MENIDKKLLDLVTWLILKWVKKHKYAKHKMDFFLMVVGWEAAIWIASIIVNFATGKRNGINLVVNGVILAAITTLEGAKYLVLQKEKEYYDWLWEYRKNPNVYKATKEHCEHWFQAPHHKKQRHIVLVFFLVFLVLLIVVHSVISIVYVSFILSLYKECIFDMDEPPKKEKKAINSLTEITLRAWQSLTGSLNPKGVN